MKMRSPIVAILWENWRLTRVEAAWRLGLGIVAGSTAILWFDSVTAAFWIVLWLNAFIWFSIAKLNGGRFMDGYKPGFPFYLHYTRPVPTALFVGVAVAYDAISGAVMYLVTAALLGLAWGQPLPLFTVTAWIVASRLAYACVQWSTPNRSVQWAGSIAFSWPMFILLTHRVASPLNVEFSLIEDTAMVLIGVVAFCLTVAGVARQRRGDSVATAPQAKVGSAGYPDWMISVFRFPCPTSSATRAQVWFELKSSGLPVLMIGLTMAVLIFLLYALGIAAAPFRAAAVAAPIMFGLPVLLFILGGNAFGIRKKQGRTYVSAFEATQPCGTAQLAGVKVLVRTTCLLAALAVVGVSLWASSSLVNTWDSWVPDGQQVDAKPGLLRTRQEFADAFGGLTIYALASLAVVMSVAVALMVAWLASFKALWMRYSRRVLIAGSLLLLCGLALILLAWGVKSGLASEFLLHAILTAAVWTAAAALLFATIYLFWSGFSERALTIRYVCGAVLISAAFAAAILSRIPAVNAGIVWPVLLLLMVSVLAPWSLNRIRHA